MISLSLSQPIAAAGPLRAEAELLAEMLSAARKPDQGQVPLYLCMGYFLVDTEGLRFAAEESALLAGEGILLEGEGAYLCVGVLLGGATSQEAETAMLERNWIGDFAIDFKALESPVRPGATRLGLALRRALAGEPEALDEGSLTLKSLHAFFGGLGRVSEDLLLVDFNAPLLPESFGEFPLLGVRLVQESGLRVKNVLSSIKHWQNYDQRQLEYAVNRELDRFLQEEVARHRAVLKREFFFTDQELRFEENALRFPEGALSYQYRALGKKQGVLEESLELGEAWLERPESCQNFLRLLKIHPERAEFLLKVDLEPKELGPALSARGYQLLSEGEDRLRLSKGLLVAEILPDRIAIHESQAASLFLPGNSQEAMELMARIFG